MDETQAPQLPATTTAPARKPSRVPRTVRDAIEALVSGQARTITAAAQRVGLARETLSRWLIRPEGAEALRARAAKEVAMSAGRSAARLNELIESASQKVALDSVKYSLGVAGIKPAPDTQVNVNLNVKAGYIIDLHEDNEPEAKILNGVAKVVDAKPVGD